MKKIVRILSWNIAILFSFTLIIELIFYLSASYFPYNLQLALSPFVQEKLLTNKWTKIGNEVFHIQPYFKINDAVVHDEIGFYNKPGKFTNNSQIDIVAIGDSFTHGNGELMSYPIHLENIRNQKVLNLGLQGAGPDAYLEIFKEYGKQKNPKIVLFGFMLANDFADTKSFVKCKTSKKRPIPAHGCVDYFDYSFDGTFGFISKYSSFFGVIKRLYQKNNIEPKKPPKKPPIYTIKRNNKLVKQAYYWRHIAEPVFDKGSYLHLEKILIELKKTVEGDSTKIILILFTQALAVYAPYFMNDPLGEIPGVIKEYNAVKTNFNELAKRNDICFFDSLPSLRKQVLLKKELLYTSDHMSNTGYAVFAEALSEFINKCTGK